MAASRLASTEAVVSHCRGGPVDCGENSRLTGEFIHSSREKREDVRVESAAGQVRFA
jgi:hypothetical protein